MRSRPMTPTRPRTWSSSLCPSCAVIVARTWFGGGRTSSRRAS